LMIFKKFESLFEPSLLCVTPFPCHSSGHFHVNGHQAITSINVTEGNRCPWLAW
jgi:hypothetical protein